MARGQGEPCLVLGSGDRPLVSMRGCARPRLLLSAPDREPLLCVCLCGMWYVVIVLCVRRISHLVARALHMCCVCIRVLCCHIIYRCAMLLPGNTCAHYSLSTPRPRVSRIIYLLSHDPCSRLVNPYPYTTRTTLLYTHHTPCPFTHTHILLIYMSYNCII